MWTLAWPQWDGAGSGRRDPWGVLKESPRDGQGAMSLPQRGPGGGSLGLAVFLSLSPSPAPAERLLSRADPLTPSPQGHHPPKCILHFPALALPEDLALLLEKEHPAGTRTPS